MTFKKVTKVVTEVEENKFAELMKEVSEIDSQLLALQERREQVQTEMLEIKLKPFKLGQEVLAEIPSGRTRKWQKCLLESERGILFLRPIKADGSYSERHFSLVCSDYSEFLKEV